MMKHIAAAFIVLSTTTFAFAQNLQGKQDMRFREIEKPRSQFSQYLMRGFSVGLEYALLNGDAKVKWRNSSGNSGTVTSSTGREAGTAGVSLNYGSLPRGDFGMLIGLGVQKKLEDNKTSPANTLASSGPMTQIRPEGNIAFSFANGLYGAAGGNLSYLIMDEETFISNFGAGIQAQVGFIPMRNLSFDIGYYISRHMVKEITFSNEYSWSKTETNGESYVDLNQARFRMSYLF